MKLSPCVGSCLDTLVTIHDKSRNFFYNPLICSQTLIKKYLLKFGITIVLILISLNIYEIYASWKFLSKNGNWKFGKWQILIPISTPNSMNHEYWWIETSLFCTSPYLTPMVGHSVFMQSGGFCLPSCS